MKRNCFLFVICVILNTKARAYFGLTGKEQLHDLWSINLNSASLATSSDEPEPSREYEQVDLSPQPDPPISPKPKRMAARHEDTQYISDGSDRSRWSGSSRPPSRKRPGYANQPYTRETRKTKRNQINDLQNGPPNRPTYQNQAPHKPRIPYVKRFTPPKYSNRLQSKVRGTAESRLQGRVSKAPRTHTTRDVNPHQRRHHKTSPTLSALNEKLHSQRLLTGGVNVRGNLSQDIDVIMKQISKPHSRSERESEKMWPINPSRYRKLIISSHNKNSRIPELGRWPSKDRLPSQGVPGANDTIRVGHNSEPFLGLDQASFEFYSKFVAGKMGNFTLLEPENINKDLAKKLCNTFQLTNSQRKKCRRDPGLPQVLTEATHIAAAECQYQFRFEKWNCSLGTSRIQLLNKGNKETAFLYSISSAGLTHSVARACANGHLEKCSCQENPDESVDQKVWLWGGCGDNVKYAARFVRNFLESRSDSLDLRAQVDKHNSDLGIRIVKSNVKPKCKCHGVSGSCTTKTCWNRLKSFYEIGKKLKRAYNKAVQVESINNSNGSSRLIRLRRSGNRRQKFITKQSGRHITSPQTTSRGRTSPSSTRRNARLSALNSNTNPHRPPPSLQKAIADNRDELPRKKELVYLESSPAYCKRSRISLGTKGRTCDSRNNCQKVCCGRGYTTHVQIIKKSCECEVKWCCDLQCKTCTERKMIHTCK
ncbi:unnamed protein product [Clavelina lepadiformis]|uniref:Protein Wnt n=1 Tax=Clavelina lepadiformis TaxID=159417 RepID=A0ABP0F509_CLALP